VPAACAASIGLSEGAVHDWLNVLTDAVEVLLQQAERQLEAET